MRLRPRADWWIARTCLKVLIVAQNASTRFGGEAILPVHYYRILRSRGFHVRMIAHDRNKDDLQEHLGPWMDHVELVPDTAYHKAIWRAGQPFPRGIREPLFGTALNFVNEMYQRRIIRKLIDGGEVDIIHQPIPVSPKAPSSIHGFGVPVVIGPMNGAMTYPDGYEDYQTVLERRFIAFGRAAAGIANRAIPGKRRATTLLVANERTRTGLPASPAHVEELVENGVVLSTWDVPSGRQASTGFRLAFMGRLVNWKAVDVTLQAVKLAQHHIPDLHLDILGDGPERNALEQLARVLGIADNVTFHGFQPQDACASILANSDAFILNSLFECGGAVLLEAMSMGIPVIASDWGGPADYIDPSCGILLDPSPRSSFPQRLAEAVQTLQENPEKARAMGAAGATKVREHFDWERKLDRVIDIYDEAISRFQEGRQKL